MPKFASVGAWAPPLSGLAEAIPADASIIASMSAVASKIVSFLTSCVLFPQKGQGDRPRLTLYNAITLANTV